MQQQSLVGDEDVRAERASRNDVLLKVEKERKSAALELKRVQVQYCVLSRSQEKILRDRIGWASGRLGPLVDRAVQVMTESVA